MELFQQLVDQGKLTADEAKALVEGLEAKMQTARTEVMTKAQEHIKAEFTKIQETLEAKDAQIQALTESQGMSEEDVKTALLQLENKLVGELSLYIKEVSTSQISEELIAKTAKFELFESTFNGIVGLIGEGIANLDPVIAEKKNEIDGQLQAGLKESNEKIASLEGLLESVKKDLGAMSVSNQKILAENVSLQKGLLILKESDGLTESEQEKMLEHFKGKTLEETKSGLAEYKKIVESQSVSSLVDNFKRDKDRSKHKKGAGRTIEQTLSESQSIEQVTQSDRVQEQPVQLSEQQKLFNQAGQLVD